MPATLPHLLLPRAQRTSRLRESLRELGEEGGGQAGARMKAAGDGV
jgi:hypothetical protein